MAIVSGYTADAVFRNDGEIVVLRLRPHTQQVCDCLVEREHLASWEALDRIFQAQARWEDLEGVLQAEIGVAADSYEQINL